jgi:hypothetical protein
MTFGKDIFKARIYTSLTYKIINSSRSQPNSDFMINLVFVQISSRLDLYAIDIIGRY